MRTTFALCIAAVSLSACGGGGSAVGPGTAPPPAAPAPVPGGGSATPVAVNTNSFASLLNGVRPAGSQVSFDSRLAAAAQVQSNHQAATNTLTHDGPGGLKLVDRIRAQGYNPRTWGENVAVGYANEQAVFNGWQNSPGHRANNENTAFRDFGLARANAANGRPYWTLVLATEQ